MKSTRTIAICAALLMIASACIAAGPIRPGRAPRPDVGPGQINLEWWRPGPGNPASRFVVHGTVLQVDANSIQVQTVARGVMGFVVNDKTKVIVGHQPGSMADVVKDDVVNVKFQPVPNGTPVALGIQLPKDQEAAKNHVQGKITAVDGNVITVHNPKGDVKVTVGADTKIMSRRYKGSLADLKVGYGVAVAGEPSAPKLIEFMPAMAKGAVTEINGKIITVKTIRQDIIKVEAGTGTAVLIKPRVGPNVPGTLADVKAGSPVNIGYHANQGGTGQLLWIEVLTGI